MLSSNFKPCIDIQLVNIFLVWVLVCESTGIGVIYPIRDTKMMYIMILHVPNSSVLISIYEPMFVISVEKITLIYLIQDDQIKDLEIVQY